MQANPAPALTRQNVYVLDFVLIALRKKEVCCGFPHQWFVGETLWGKAHGEIGKKRFRRDLPAGGYVDCRVILLIRCRNSHCCWASLGPVWELAAGGLNVQGATEWLVSSGGGRAIVIKKRRGVCSIPLLLFVVPTCLQLATRVKCQ